MSIQHTEIEMRIEIDQDGDASYLEQEGFEDRLAAYKRDDFHFVGVVAVCDVIVPTDDPNIVRRHQMTSPGLWSIESDSGDDYFEEVFKEEEATLMEDLKKIGAAS